jgi:hypothetical protein
MIIAILEDRKGFRTSFALANFFPEVYVPVHHVLGTNHVYTTSDEELATAPIFKKLTFRFQQWLDNKRKVAFYKEWTID